MAGKDNLRKLTTEEAREIGKKGGKASVEARRERKAIREEIEIAMSTGNYGKRVSLALLDKASAGDVSATKLLLEILGEYTQKTESTVDTTVKVEITGFED